MTKRALIAVMVVLAAGLPFTNPAQAQAAHLLQPDAGGPWNSLQDVQNALPGVLDDMFNTYSDCPLWSTACGGNPTSISSQVIGQNGPTWSGTADHGAATSPSWAYSAKSVPETSYLGLVDRVASGACTGLSVATENAIKASWDLNLAKPVPEVALGSTRITANVNYSGTNVNVDHTTTLTTGQENSICATVLVINTCFPFDVPPMGELLDEADVRLEPALRNMTAAYMTGATPKGVAYWRSFMGKLAFTFVKELLPGILNNLDFKSDGSVYVPTSDPGEALRAAVLMGISQIELTPADDKADTPCAPWGTSTDLDTGTLPRIEFDGGYIDNARVRIPGGNICTGITAWASNYDIGVGKYSGQAARLAVATNVGDLNGDGTFNFSSWTASGGSFDAYAMRENAMTPNPVTISAQPAGNWASADPNDPGSPVITNGNWTLTVGMLNPHVYDVDWYYGATPDTLALVQSSSSLSRQYTGLPWGVSYAKAVVKGKCGAADATSNTVALKSVPPITVFAQVPARIAILEDEYYADVPFGAQIGDSTALTFQWFRKVGVATEFTEFGLPTADGLLNIPEDPGAPQGAGPADSGQYFCRVTSNVWGHSIDSQVTSVNVVSFDSNVYDPFAQSGPQGRVIDNPAVIAVDSGATPPTITVDGTPYLGELAATDIAPGVAVFRFESIKVGAGAAVTLAGNRPVSILAAGDMVWDAAVTVTPGTLGGGAGGAGGAGG
ncbi:MAG: hypothetical protein GX580_03375, partial [Candidatus Hydrogenedens sp.]|nr:hypothetical protein [Candidatus Hydrogenedens sp.]